MLSMDRTNWMFGKFKINILYLAINYKGMAIPILWTLLPKKGYSNTQERIDLLERFQKIFPEQPVRRLLADREFRGIRWLKYLRSHHWPFCIRIPVNTLVPNKHQNRELPIRRLFSLGIGETMAMKKPRKVWGQVHRRSRKSSHEPRSSSLKKKINARRQWIDDKDNRNRIRNIEIHFEKIIRLMPDLYNDIARECTH